MTEQLPQRLQQIIGRLSEGNRSTALALHALIYFRADYETGRAAARLGATITRDAEAN